MKERAKMWVLALGSKMWERRRSGFGPAIHARRAHAIARLGVTTVVCTVAIACVLAQAKNGTARALFDIPIKGEAASLLREVERLFNTQVREEWLDESAGMSGKSKVSDDGVPTIQLRRDDASLDVIVHELYHMKLKGEGYPAVMWLYPKPMDTDANRAAFAQRAEQVHDPIEHHMFYGTVRAWGINPGRSFEKQTLAKLQDGSLPATFATMDRGAVGLYYFKVRLEVGDAELFNQIVESLTRAGKQPGMDLGERLSQIVLKANPKTPESEIGVMLDCLNSFYEGKFQFRQSAWITRLLGKHAQQVAPIEVVEVL
jgi:hypothetical protein